VTKPAISRAEELSFFSRRFSLSPKEILEFVKHYNSDFSQYDNHIYEHIGSRIAHWWNFETHDWFAKRIDIYLDYLEKITSDPRARVFLLDIGFSIPYVFSRHRLVQRNNLSCLLVDKERSAKRFFYAVRDHLKVTRVGLDQVMVADIERPDDRKQLLEQIRELGAKQRPNQLLLAGSEVIEHLDDPEAFWMLADAIKLRRSGQINIYATLPIGKKIPSHTLEFLTAADAFEYLSARLNIRDKWFLKPPARKLTSPYLQECVCVLGTLKKVST